MSVSSAIETANNASYRSTVPTADDATYKTTCNAPYESTNKATNDTTNEVCNIPLLHITLMTLPTSITSPSPTCQRFFHSFFPTLFCCAGDQLDVHQLSHRDSQQCVLRVNRLNNL